MSISIIIPAYNERESIGKCLTLTSKVFKDQDYELIVVNDGSKDDTLEEINKFINENIKVVSYPKNHGYSFAIRKGLVKAGKKYIGILDADLQYSPKDLLSIYKIAEKSGLKFVIGKPSNKYQSNMTRKVISSIYRLYVRLALGFKLPDPNSLKVIDRKFLQRFRLKMERGMIDLEIVKGVLESGVPVQMHPIEVYKREAGKSKASLKLAVRTMIDCARLRGRQVFYEN